MKNDLNGTTALTPPGSAGPAPGMGGGQPPAPQDPAAPDGSNQATPEEQEQYDHFVSNALNLIADPKNTKVRESVINLLGSGNPVEALASAAVYVVDAVEKSAAKNGIELPPAVMMEGGTEIVGALADLQAAKNIADLEPGDVDAAYLKAVDMYREKNKDRLDPAVAQEDMQTLTQADQAGTIDQLLPGINEAAGQIKQGIEKEPDAPAAEPKEAA